MSSSPQYLRSNPLAEHNSGIALSDKQIPVGGTGNMYVGQAGRAFVQGGGTRRKTCKTGNGKKKCNCDIVTGFGGGRRRSHKITCHLHNKHSYTLGCKCKACRNKRISHRRRRTTSRRRHSQHGGNGNAAYSVAGMGTDVNRNMTALANPAPYTAYNSCHPVA